MPRLLLLIRRRLEAQDGQGLAEYALILAFIAIVAISAVTFFGTSVNNQLSYIGSSIQSAAP